jgi:hypothetical protein
MICIRTGVQALLGLSRNYWITMCIAIKAIGSTLLAGVPTHGVGVVLIRKSKPRTMMLMEVIAHCG